MSYASAEEFRQALQDRLRRESQHQPHLRVERLRKRIVFERFLARLQMSSPDTWVIKGGMALELRFGERARTTRDLDIATVSDQSDALRTLLGAAMLDLGDQFEFEVELADARLQDEGEKTLRMRLRSYLANQRFEFTAMDVGLEKPISREVVIVEGSSLLSFAGIDPIRVPALPLEDHLAEKLHACTRIYADGRPSSRAKDLVDIVMIVGETTFESERLWAAIERTFESRKTHRPPARFPVPPDFWQRGYSQMAPEIGIDPDLMAGYRIATAFFDPVLSGEVSTHDVWSSETLQWAASRRGADID